MRVRIFDKQSSEHMSEHELDQVPREGEFILREQQAESDDGRLDGRVWRVLFVNYDFTVFPHVADVVCEKFDYAVSQHGH